MDSLLPAFLITLAVVTLGLLVFTAGVILQIIPYE